MKVRDIVKILGFAGLFIGGYFLGTNGIVHGDADEGFTETSILSAGTMGEVAPEKQARILNDEESATIALFEHAAPSVAFINTATYRHDYWTRDITEIPRGSGSGFVWDKEGHIVTNFHVIQDADKATVTLSDQSTWDADLVGYAPEKDLAILKIKVPRSKLVPILVGTSEDLLVGQSVYAIGNPFGLDQTLTTGIISALGREIKSRTGTPIRDVIQTDAAINPGNSGGPLLDSQGKLIGVNTAIYSPSGAYAGIGFSIPVDQINWVVPDLIKYGRVKRLILGVDLFSQSAVTRAGIEGAVVSNVNEGSAAEEAGVRPIRRNNRGEIILGDIIIGVNDDNIKSNTDLQLALEKYKAGDEVQLKLMRDGEKISLSVALDSN